MTWQQIHSVVIPRTYPRNPTLITQSFNSRFLVVTATNPTINTKAYKAGFLTPVIIDSDIGEICSKTRLLRFRNNLIELNDVEIGCQFLFLPVEWLSSVTLTFYINNI